MCARPVRRVSTTDRHPSLHRGRQRHGRIKGAVAVCGRADSRRDLLGRALVMAGLDPANATQTLGNLRLSAHPLAVVRTIMGRISIIAGKRRAAQPAFLCAPGMARSAMTWRCPVPLWWRAGRLGGESPLRALMTGTASRTAKASSRGGVRRKLYAKLRPDEQEAHRGDGTRARGQRNLKPDVIRRVPA